MRKLSVFNSVSVDGYFSAASGDQGWMHRNEGDPEQREFVAANASGGSELVFGRKTYEMMASFWPTPLAAQRLPAVAERMNALPKLVFSNTLASVAWHGTKAVKGDPVAEMRRLKAGPGAPLVILGSGTLVAALAGAGLVDEIQMLVLPVALGAGRTMFEGARAPIPLRLTSSRVFQNGAAFLVYEVGRGAA
jgi:dihydrofolate reductase